MMGSTLETLCLDLKPSRNALRLVEPSKPTKKAPSSPHGLRANFGRAYMKSQPLYEL